MNKELDEFLEKSNIICYECKKPIMEINFLFCKNCNKNIHILCEKFHSNNNKNHNAEFINKNHILNQCKNHNSYYIFRCMECKESLCGQCDLFSHNQKHHHLKQLMEFDINENELTKMKSALNTQKNFLMKIKNINSAYIKKFENDIQIKQKIINNYIDNKSNYCSVLNLKNVYLKNNEKYENVLNDLINNNEENQNNKNKILDIDKYTDEILLPFYYSMMINKDESLNNSIIENLENKIKKLKTNKSKHLENQYSIQNNNNNDFNSEIIQDSNFNSQTSKKIQQYFPNQVNSNNKKISNNQIQNNIENNEFSLFSPKNDISNIKSYNNKIKEDDKYNSDKNNNQKKVKKNNHLSENNKSNEKSAIKKEKTKITNNEKDNNIRNNMIALKSGNYAISIKKRIEIYNFRKLNFIKAKDFVEKSKIEECLLQEIVLDKKGKGRYINNIFQFTDETLFCSIYSKLIRIRLLNDDKEHEIINFIDLENMELVRKMISLGDSLLVTLSDKGNHCKIKIYERNDESEKNNLNNYNIIKDEFNLICSGIFNNNNIQNNNILNDEKENQLSNDINKINQIQNNNENQDNIKKDCEFKLILNDINKEKIIWNSMLELIKEKNDENYLYEFILTSNADFNDGEDWVVFYGVKKIFGEYKVEWIKKIEGISCSSEPDTICQLNKKYICIGLQDYGLDQKNGFALIDINNRILFKIIEKNEPIYSIFYLKEKKILLATMDSDIKEPNFLVRAYKFLKSSEDKDKNKDEYTLNEIYNYKSEQIDVIVSIHSLLIPDLNNKILIITSSSKSNIEIKKAEIQNL